MKQLSLPTALRPLLLVCGIFFAASPVFAASPSRPPAPSLTSLIMHQDSDSETVICASGDAAPTILARVTSALTVAALHQAEPGFVLIDDVDSPAVPGKATPGAAKAALAARLADAEPVTHSADTRDPQRKLTHLADIPWEWADKAKDLSAHIVQKFKVDQAHANKVVKTVYSAGQQTGLPPNLILAVIAVESSFKPTARNGNARGLMQIIPFWHKKRVNQVGGPTELMKPDKNIAVGSAILREYLDRSENVFQALKRYNGSAKAHAYSEKVLKQKRGFDAVAAPAIR